LPFDPRFTGSNLAEDDEFLRVTKVCNMTSFRGEVKMSAMCCKILWHVKSLCGMKEILVGKIHGHISLSFPASLLGVSAGYCQRALVDVS
jgi:hypothetical protein